MTNKIIYVIPGLGENCNLLRYKKLIQALESKGYKVIAMSPDWYAPISQQVFAVEKEAIVCGFSMGAVLAYLIAEKTPCKKAIFASMSPIHTFSFEEYKNDLLSYMSGENAALLAQDVKSIEVDLKTLKTPFVTLAGAREKDLKADVSVPQSGHRMTDTYIRCIVELLE